MLPSQPSYLLESPDRQTTHFDDLLRSFNGFERGKPWLDLEPLMELRIENAYYQPGFPRRGLAGFLGTEIALYEILAPGLKLLSVQSMNGRPSESLPVEKLVAPSQQRFRYYRFYYEIFFPNTSNAHTSVLLGANSPAELAILSGKLDHPETVCSATSPNCTVFPEACSVSLEMKVVVNGKTQSLLWGSLLESVFSKPGQLNERAASPANRPARLAIKRLYAGRLLPVKLDVQDPAALRLPLLPGDQIRWR